MNDFAPPPDLTDAVARALAEDVGDGDLTAALVPAGRAGRATIVTREPAVLCGRPWVDEVFRQLDPSVRVLWDAEEGADVAPGQRLCRISGPARSLLTGERTALNFLQTLSGTATATRRYVAAVAGLPCRILDTRKTLPGLRRAQKYAVRCAGGSNHRMGLYDGILVKENHIMAAGSIAAAVDAARAAGSTVPARPDEARGVGQRHARNAAHRRRDGRRLRFDRLAHEARAGGGPLDALRVRRSGLTRAQALTAAFEMRCGDATP